MAGRHSRQRFVTKYLDPTDRLEEVLCGLIMVLDFTLIAGVTAGKGKLGVRPLLMGALGCNVAWGIIDGALYVMGSLTGRRERLRFLTDLRKEAHETAAFSAIGGRLDPYLEPETSAEERLSICRVVLPVMSRIQLPQPGITKDDIYGLIAIFAIDLASVIPAIVPFLIFSEPRFALRVSNALLIACLFGAGFMWGKYTGINRYLAGSFAMLLGLALVGVAIALGG
jgi:VIT1/CCC1 family predicted Fe2+/Mn2+ transporter